MRGFPRHRSCGARR
ncbi:hypothetical protein AB0B67_06765 [Streptomyces spectabilis]